MKEVTLNKQAPKVGPTLSQNNPIILFLIRNGRTKKFCSESWGIGRNVVYIFPYGS